MKTGIKRKLKDVNITQTVKLQNGFFGAETSLCI